jgi:hypothetical protein
VANHIGEHRKTECLVWEHGEFLQTLFEEDSFLLELVTRDGAAACPIGGCRRCRPGSSSTTADALADARFSVN